MPKFKSSNKFTKSFKKRSPFQQEKSGMDLGTTGADATLVNAANEERKSRKQADVQKGLADSDQTVGFGLQAGLVGLAKGAGSLTAALGDDFFSKENKSERKKWKEYKKEFKGKDFNPTKEDYDEYKSTYGDDDKYKAWYSKHNPSGKNTRTL